MSNDIRRTVFQIEVFSDGPLVLDAPDNDPFDLATINYLITEGDCIGLVSTISQDEIVPSEKVRDELLRIGNDGDFFFGLDDDDEEVDL
jgi:hypothetical protein